MHLAALFDDLPCPEGSTDTYNAIETDRNSKHKLGVTKEGFPVLMLSINDKPSFIGFKNLQTQYLKVLKNIDCKILENGITTIETYTIIMFLSNEKELQVYFFKLCELLISGIDTSSTIEDVQNYILKFIEIFRSFSDAPRKTVQGLWAEIFVILNSSNPAYLIEKWHHYPEQIFDFDTGYEKLEVKSSSNNFRMHSFSAAQLNALPGSQILIASILVRSSNRGLSIEDLMTNIIKKLPNPKVVLRFQSIIIKTLGNSMAQSNLFKYDLDYAKSSIRFYLQNDILKIDEAAIPDGVKDVKYKSDLSKTKHVSISELKPKKGSLFDAL